MALIQPDLIRGGNRHGAKQVHTEKATVASGSWEQFPAGRAETLALGPDLGREVGGKERGGVLGTQPEPSQQSLVPPSV